MPPVTPSRIRAIRTLCLPAAHADERPLARPSRDTGRGALLLRVLVLDLALADLLQGHGQVVLRARFDERRRGLFEAHALAELVVVVVDLPCALRGHDDERVARVHVVEQGVDAGMDHGAMVAASVSSRSTSAASASVARATSSFRTM